MLALRGTAYRRDGAMQPAASDFGKAIELRPEAANVYLARASALFQLEDYLAALADVDAAILRDPNSAEAYTQRGRIDAAQGNADQAIADFTQAIALDPCSLMPTATAVRSRPSAAISTPRSPTSTSPSSVPRTWRQHTSRAPTRWRKGTTRRRRCATWTRRSSSTPTIRWPTSPGAMCGCGRAAPRRRSPISARRSCCGRRWPPPITVAGVLTCWERICARRGRTSAGAPARPEDGSRQEAAGECGSPRPAGRAGRAERPGTHRAKIPRRVELRRQPPEWLRCRPAAAGQKPAGARCGAQGTVAHDHLAPS